MIKHILKNIFRNTRRSTMILIIISLSMTLVFLTYSYLQTMYWGLRTQAQQAVGQLQIATHRYWKTGAGADALMDEHQLLATETQLKQDRMVQRYDVELSFEALAGNEQGSTIVKGVGVTPGAQDGAAGNMLALNGHTLQAGEQNSGVVGNGVADALDVAPGKWLSIMAQTVSGAYNAMSFHVGGVVTTGSSDGDRYFVALPIAEARKLLQTNGADRVLVFLTGNPSDQELDRIQRQWNESFRSKSLNLEAKTWHELATYYFQLKSLYDVIFTFITVIILLLVFLSVFEIISMAFFERTREVGTLRAIGNTKGEVFLLLCAEVALLYVIGLVVGLSLGFLARISHTHN